MKYKGYFRRVTALSKKEFIQIVKDPSSFLVAFIMPMMLLVLFGAGISLDAKNLRLGVVIEDDTDQAHSIARSFSFSKYFDVSFSKTAHGMAEEVSSGNLHGFINIPSYFTKDLKKPYRSAPIQLITDGSNPNTATFTENYVQATLNNWIDIRRLESGLGEAPTIHAATRFWFNEELNSHYFLIPGSIVIILTIAGTLLTSLVVAKEWEKGSMEALMATPVTMKEIIFSKFVTYFIMGLGTLLVVYVIARLVFQVPFRGTFGLLLVSACAYLSFSLSLGLLISVVTKNQFAAIQASLVTSFLPAFILSGFLFEISSMPLPLQWLSYSLPPTYFVQSLQTLFLAGDVYAITLPNIAILLTYAAFLLAISAMKTKKRLD